jgi:predicted dinucleotide-binding enzyme
MTSIGFIGAGNIASAVAARAVAAGIDRVVLSNSRGADSLAGLARSIGPQVEARDPGDAAEADVVFLAVPWSRIPAALGRVPSWAGRVLVDTTNPIEAPAFQPIDLGGSTSSSVVASHAPGAHVVKAFNTLSPAVLRRDPQVAGGRRVIFFSGDEERAKRAVGSLIAALGFQGIDLGGLVEGGRLHQFPGGPLPSRDLIQLSA